MADELIENAEFGRKRRNEEEPILVAQRFLNIYRQMHIFNKERQEQFDNMLLELSPDIRILLSTLPGGSLLLEHIEELEQARGLISLPINTKSSVASKNKMPLKTEAAKDKTATAGNGNLVIDASFATELSNSLSIALQQTERRYKDDIKTLTETITHSIMESQSAIANMMKEILTNSLNAHANNDNVLAAPAQITSETNTVAQETLANQITLLSTPKDEETSTSNIAEEITANSSDNKTEISSVPVTQQREQHDWEESKQAQSVQKIEPRKKSFEKKEQNNKANPPVNNKKDKNKIKNTSNNLKQKEIIQNKIENPLPEAIAASATNNEMDGNILLDLDKLPAFNLETENDFENDFLTSSAQEDTEDFAFLKDTPSSIPVDIKADFAPLTPAPQTESNTFENELGQIRDALSIPADAEKNDVLQEDTARTSIPLDDIPDAPVSLDDIPDAPVSLDDIPDAPVSLDDFLEETLPAQNLEAATNKSLQELDAANFEEHADKAQADSENLQSENDEQDWEWAYTTEENDGNSEDWEWEYVEDDGSSDDWEWEYVEDETLPEETSQKTGES